ncbi:MAG: hypothetical protein AAGF31_04970 [Planctomycetota bacterium]
MRTLPTLAGLIAAVLAAGALTSVANAQRGAFTEASEFNGYHPSSSYTTPSYAPTPPNSRIRHASTTYEGVGRAIAGIMKAHADGMLSYAQARILIAEAEARELQLRVINTETHLTRRRLLDEAREAERHRKWEQEQLAFARRQQREQTVLYAAYRLPSHTLNRVTGEIAWPAMMECGEFGELTGDINALFAELAIEGAQYDRLYRDPIVDQIELARNHLWRNRKAMQIDWDEYLACQKLLVGLKYEAENWPAAGNGAGRLVASR